MSLINPTVIILSYQSNSKMQKEVLPETTQGKINLGETSNQSINPEDTRGEKKLNEVPAQKAGILANKKIVIAIVVGVLLLAGLIIGLAVGLTRKKTAATPAPTPTFCELNPDTCTGLNPLAKSYIESFSSPNQIKSLIKISFALQSIGTTNAQEKLNAFNSVLLATECLDHYFPIGHTAAYQGLINAQFTATEIQDYLNLANDVSGMPFYITSAAQLADRCSGAIASESPSPPPIRRALAMTPCTFTQILLFMGQFGQTPSSIVQNLREIQRRMEAGSTPFTGGYVYLGFKKTGSNIFDAAAGDFISSQGGAAPSADIVKKCIQLIIDQSNVNTVPLPDGITRTQFLSLKTKVRMTRTSSYYTNLASNYNRDGVKNWIKDYVAQGLRVILFGHGSGAMASNSIYSYMDNSDKTSIAQVSIAPFASSMADSSTSYITHNQDQAISDILSAGGVGVPLGSTGSSTSFSATSDSGEKHGIKGYFGAYGAEILTAVNDALGRITAAATTVNTGLIQIFVYWGGTNPDLDLHILEPSSHVWSGNTNGNNGVLDIVDSDGDGPEHYYSGCTLEPGNYVVKLNYRTGTTHEYPVITVYAGSAFYQVRLDLGYIAGSHGDDNPPFGVCTINVARSGSSYKFEITPDPLY